MKKINLTKLLFTAIDKAFYIPQNPRLVERNLKKVKCIANIPYSEQYPEMALDLYFLPRNGKYPVVMEIHGGGFSAGDKKYRRCFCRYVAQYTGAMVVNVNYGVGEKYACPQPMQQLAQAVNWIAHNADKYGMDLSRFVVTGDSAGAYYSAFLCVLQDSEYLQRLFESALETRFSAAVLNCGIYDMHKALNKKSPLINGVCREFTGLSIDEVVHSPYFDGLSVNPFVTENFPPTLLIYSKTDVFCKGQGEDLRNLLCQKGVEVHDVCARSILDNHVYSLMWITNMARQTNKKILCYLNEHFYGRETENWQTLQEPST